MGSRARGACLVALAIVAIGCQKVWGFEDFEEGPGVGGAAARNSGASGACSGISVKSGSSARLIRAIVSTGFGFMLA